MLLQNMTALVTGGAQGLGKGFARAILQLGGKVSMLDIQNSVGIDTQNEFNKDFGPGSAMFIRCDVRKRQELEDAFKKTKETFGNLDLVVNNAGIATTRSDDWERTLDINLTAVMRGCFLATEYMSKKNGGRGGHIINISSTAGLVAVPFDPAYAASKHGVVGLSRSFALIYKSQSIRVNCLCPSFADTSIISCMDETDNESDKINFIRSVKALGLMKVDEVIAAFTKLLEAEDQTGAVMHVTPKGFDYKYKGTPMSKL